SREIAELTGKRHDHVKRDIERMREELNPPNLGSSIFVHNGNEYTQYNLSRDLTLTLVSGYSIKLRHAIIKRLDELEKQSKPQVPQTFADALLLAANQAKELEEKNQALAIAAPKAEFADAIAGADKGVKLGQFAKAVGLGPVT
ncbi:Rha family transcriptional regulator, partial [Arthrospira platensis SPKY2]